MFCPKCGSQNIDGANFCATCGQSLAGEALQQQQQEYTPPQNSYYPPPQEDTPPPSYGYTQQGYDSPQQTNYPPQNPQAQYTNEQQQNSYYGPPINDYLVGNIVMLVLSFCCNCLGCITAIVGIVFSSGVKSALAAGNMDEAQSKAKTARIMFFVTLGLVILGIILNIVLFTTGFLSEIWSDVLYGYY